MRAVPAIIFSELLPVIPSHTLIKMFSLVIVENRQNYSKFGYRGGGFDKKSMYKMGSISYYESVFDADPNKCLLIEQPCKSKPFNFMAFSVARSY